MVIVVVIVRDTIMIVLALGIGGVVVAVVGGVEVVVLKVKVIVMWQ